MDNHNQQSNFSTQIKLIGIGGAGGAAVNRIARENLPGLEYLVINTDAQALNNLRNLVIKVRIGGNLTRGLGTGMDPELGRAAAEEEKEKIKQFLKGTDLLFISSGLGGGTGSGAAPVVAGLAKKMGMLTVAILTMPFQFEGRMRKNIAARAVKQLADTVDAVITIPNDRILSVVDKGSSLVDGFKFTDKILSRAVYGIYDILATPGLVNVDFADVKSIMKGAGRALFTLGEARGKSRARDAVKDALESPLLDLSLKGAQGILFIIQGPSDLSLAEVEQIAGSITQQADKSAKIIFGAVINDELKEKVKLTVIATGFEEHPVATKRATLSPISQIKTRKIEGAVSEPEPEEEGGEKEETVPRQSEYSEEELEIPAFLRRKKQKKKERI